MSRPMADARAERNFVLQQGLEVPAGESCVRLSSALMFQPRVVGLTVLAGVFTQSAAVFAVLAAVLWWSALLPRFSPFDFIHNRMVGTRPGAMQLGPAPDPRRMAQGMAASFATAIVFCLAGQHRLTAVILEGILGLANGALVFGRLCLGSFLYHLLRRRVDFAIRTLPWSRGA